MEQQPVVMMVEIGVTRQPESYQSVRAGVSLPVFVYPGADAQGLLMDQITQAMETVRAQIDDEFERGHGKPAPYSTEPRFTLLVARSARVMVIVPADQVEELPEAWERECRKEYRGHRLGHILQQSGREYRRYTLVDCSDGDWSKLPALEQMTVWKYRPLDSERESKFWVIVKRGVEFNRKDYPGWWNHEEYFRLNNGAFWVELEEQAIKAGATLYDGTDGDFGGLPKPVKPEPVEEEEDEWADDDDNNNEDE